MAPPPERAARAAAALTCAALVALPFESPLLAVRVGPLLVTLPEALLGLAVVATAMAAWLARRRWPVCPDPALGLALAALAVVLVASTVAAPDSRLDAAKFTLRLAGGGLFGLAVAWLIRSGALAPGQLLGAYAAGAGIGGLVGLLEIGVAPHLDPVLASFRERAQYFGESRRLTGPFGSPNAAAAAMALALPVGLAAAARAGGRRRAVLGAGVALTALALVLTYSRGGVMAASVGLGALALLASPRLGLKPVRAAACLGFGVLVGLWLGLVPSDRFAFWRVAPEGDATRLTARLVAPAGEPLVAVAGNAGTMAIAVTNTGRVAWRATADAPYRLTSAWHDERGVPLGGERVGARLPPLVEPGETVTVEGRYRVPSHEGRAWIAWDLEIGQRLRFSELGGAPAWVAAVVGRDAAGARRLAVDGAGTAVTPPARAPWVNPTRLEMWRAALAMAAERPWLGHGPDSYRRVYGRYMGRAWWDRTVFANNVIFELLATTGVLGLAAFLAVVLLAGWRGLRAWRSGAPWAAVTTALLAAWLAHGMVDYFLAFTAGYVSLFALAGLGSGLAFSTMREDVSRDNMSRNV
jgi:hypothetical protein